MAGSIINGVKTRASGSPTRLAAVDLKRIQNTARNEGARAPGASVVANSQRAYTPPPPGVQVYKPQGYNNDKRYTPVNQSFGDATMARQAGGVFISIPGYNKPPGTMVQAPSEAPPGSQPTAGSGHVTQANDVPHTAYDRTGVQVGGSLRVDDNSKGYLTQQDRANVYDTTPGSTYYNEDKAPLSPEANQAASENATAALTKPTDYGVQMPGITPEKPIQQGLPGLQPDQIAASQEKIKQENAARLAQSHIVGNQRVVTNPDGSMTMINPDGSLFRPGQRQSQPATQAPSFVNDAANHLWGAGDPNQPRSTSSNIGTSISGLTPGGTATSQQALTSTPPPAKNMSVELTNGDSTSAGNIASDWFKGKATSEEVAALENMGYRFGRDMHGDPYLITPNGTTYDGSELTDMARGGAMGASNAMEGSDDLAKIRADVSQQKLDQKSEASQKVSESKLNDLLKLANEPLDTTEIERRFDDAIDNMRQTNARNKALALRSAKQRAATLGMSVNAMMGTESEANYAYDTQNSQQEAQMQLQKASTLYGEKIKHNERKLALYQQIWMLSEDKAQQATSLAMMQQINRENQQYAALQQQITAELNKPSPWMVAAQLGMQGGGMLLGGLLGGPAGAAAGGAAGNAVAAGADAAAAPTMGVSSANLNNTFTPNPLSPGQLKLNID